MALPEHKYYSLKQAAKKAGCEVEDLIHFAAIGVLEFCIRIPSGGIFYDEVEDKDVTFDDPALSNPVSLKTITVESSSSIDGMDFSSLTDQGSETHGWPEIAIGRKAGFIIKSYRSEYFHVVELFNKEKGVKYIGSWRGMLAISVTDIIECEDFLIKHPEESMYIETLSVPREHPSISNESYDVGEFYLTPGLNVLLDDIFITNKEFKLLMNGGEDVLVSQGFPSSGERYINRLKTAQKENFSKQKASLIRSLTELAFAGDGGISKLSIESLATQLQAKFRIYGIEHEDVSPANLRNWLGKPKVK